MPAFALPPVASAGFATGFGLSASLIMAIGAQNLFVLRQGLRRLHVGPVVLFCIASDVLLVWLGVAGLRAAIGTVAWLERALTLGGGAFLVWYGAAALMRAARPQAIAPGPQTGATPLRQTLRQTASFTFLNPHVYVDTVLLMGSVGGAQPAPGRVAFVAGAGIFSAVWFLSLGYGARLMGPLFRNAVAWRVLDAVMGGVLLVLALSLVRRAGIGI